jgi:hypothetical protein
MFTKTLVLALVLSGASLSFLGNVSAAQVRGGWQPAQNCPIVARAGSFQSHIQLEGILWICLCDALNRRGAEK